MSKTPRVHGSPGGITCPKYLPGHHTHWIPVLRAYVETQRIPVTIKHVEGQEFVVKFNRVEHHWFFHDPDALIAAIRTDATNFTVVKDTTFVNFNYQRQGGGVNWFNLSAKPLEECRFTDFEP